MKVFLTLILCILSFLASAQEPQIIGGYILDGKDSFEELDAAVVTDSKRRDKNLDGKGMKLPGGVSMMNPESVGKEIGSVVEIKRSFLVKAISFTVNENGMDSCKASIRIYRITGDDNLETVVTMPIQQDIPKAESKTTFHVVPQENIELDPGEYYISFCLTEIAQNIKDRWADSKTWTDVEKHTKYPDDNIYFPLYVKSSYICKDAGKPLEKCNYNIGMSVRGKILD